MESPSKRRRLLESACFNSDSSRSNSNVQYSPPKPPISSRADSSFESSFEVLSKSPAEPLPRKDQKDATDFLVDIRKYIPVGCIRIARSDTAIKIQDWQTSTHWQSFAHPRDQLSAYQRPVLPNTVQEVLLASTKLQPFRGLHYTGWIRLEFKIMNMEWGQVRVYILPDDVGRRSIDRSDVTLRKALQNLLCKLDVCEQTWNGSWIPESMVRYVNPAIGGAESDDETSLFDIFNSMPSPKPNPDIIQDPRARHAMRLLLDGDVEGLKTRMFPYQMRSAAMMLQRENQPGYIVDPRLYKCTDQNGAVWYVDTTVGTVLREARYYEGSRGGICAETMGLGKTLICLSLILATREFSSQIPQEYSVGTLPNRKKVGSLRDMAAAAVGRTGTPWKRVFSDWEAAGSTFTVCTDAIRRAPGYYLIPQPPPLRKSRNPRKTVDRKVYLSTATLVVVPVNLIRQWEYEIGKHTTDLKVLVLTDSKAEFPQAEILMDYDIILLSRQRFELEAKVSTKGNDDSTGEPYHSPLRDVHFKRLITDEGHTMGNASDPSKNNAVVVVDFLQLSARWIVSGTPTGGLFGADLLSQSKRQGIWKTTKSSVGDCSHSGTHSPDEIASIPGPPKAEIDNVQERKDLEKLGNIAKVYLKAQPWANTLQDGDSAAWAKYVMQPRHGAGSHGSATCLRSALESLIIRHRAEDVDHDIELPPLTQKTVYLEGSFQDKLSINLFALMITSNAVTSERKDADYLFHPSQRKALGALVANLRQASFFWSGFNAEDVILSVQIAESFLEKGTVLTTEEDRINLRRVIDIGTVALNNPTWRAASVHHEMPIYLKSGFPADVCAAWSLDGSADNPTLVGATQLLALQNFIRLNMYRLATPPSEFSSAFPKALTSWNYSLVGDYLKREGEKVKQKADKETTSGPTRNTKSKMNKVQKKLDDVTTALAGGFRVGQEPSPKKKPVKPPKDAKPSLAVDLAWKNAVLRFEEGKDIHPRDFEKFENPEFGLEYGAIRIPSARKEDESASNKITRKGRRSREVAENSGVADSADLYATQGRGSSDGPRGSANGHSSHENGQNNPTYLDIFDTAMIISSSSAKLSYLTSEVSKYQAEEKILIFYESDNVAYYIAQALELLSIEHRIYSKTLSSCVRAQYLERFCQAPEIRVLLMDLSQAAFGLDISCASRVYFVNPVLSKQVEAQAVKRAHRIGQWRPVYVETLILKDTIEEMIVERRKEMSNDEQKKCKTVLDDKPMYDYIKNVTFVPLPNADTYGPLQTAFLEAPQLALIHAPGTAADADVKKVADMGSERSSMEDEKGKGRASSSEGSDDSASDNLDFDLDLDPDDRIAEMIAKYSEAVMPDTRSSSPMRASLSPKSNDLHAKNTRPSISLELPVNISYLPNTSRHSRRWTPYNSLPESSRYSSLRSSQSPAPGSTNSISNDEYHGQLGGPKLHGIAKERDRRSPNIDTAFGIESPSKVERSRLDADGVKSMLNSSKNRHIKYASNDEGDGAENVGSFTSHENLNRKRKIDEDGES